MLESLEAPQFGDTDGEAILSSWMVEVGVSIKIGDVIACVETNKAMIEVEATKEGIVFELKVNVGDVLQDNQVILIITTPDTHD